MIDKDGVEIEPPIPAFNALFPQDGASTLKVTIKGGACKSKTLFCPCCACTSDKEVLLSTKKGDMRCSFCVEEYDEDVNFPH